MEEIYWESPSGHTYFTVQGGFGLDSPRACFVLFHGMYEHLGRYTDFCNWLLENNICFVGFDLPGFGHTAPTPDDLGYFSTASVEEAFADIYELLKEKHAAAPDVPFVICGKSFGTWSGLAFLASTPRDLPVAGALLIGSPGWISPLEVAGVRAVLLGKRVSRKGGDGEPVPFVEATVFGKMDRSFEGPWAWMSTDAAAIEAKRADPLCMYTYRNGFWRGFLRIRKLVVSGVPNFARVPLFFMSGADDVCSKRVRLVEKFAAALARKGADVRPIKTIAGARHDLIDERPQFRAPALAHILATLDALDAAQD
eukprot:gnl/Chilomastix_cuspidata/3125.p1 GENE.gnl/Chilomastix_cuspidata/3125~~gnl/Chilomastix_cuspidata/3125.p1  ORF type:complete len:311 (+),score=135.13 gnl/Chilomastix_cuspidata/3125:54-986(+)